MTQIKLSKHISEEGADERSTFTRASEAVARSTAAIIDGTKNTAYGVVKTTGLTIKGSLQEQAKRLTFDKTNNLYLPIYDFAAMFPSTLLYTLTVDPSLLLQISKEGNAL